MVVFSQVFLLLFFVAIGFTISKLKIVNSTHTDILSRILVYVFLPANVFKTFALNFNKDYIFKNYKIVLCSVAVLIVLNLIAHFVAKLFSKSKYERAVYEYSLATPNFGYVGYPLAESIGGQAGLLDFMTFSVPVSFFAYTVSFARLTKKSFSLKGLLNFTTISIVISMAFGLLEIPIPDIFSNIISSASACMGPVGMLMTGIIISGFNIKKVLKKWKIYPALFLRLIVIPLSVGGVMSLFCSPTLVKIAVLFYCLPCGLNTVIFPELVGEDCESGAALSMLSTVASLITIPLICSVFGI